MDKRHQRRLNKILFNFLARNPAQFLLVGNKEGWIRLSDIHKALVEEKMAANLTPKTLRQYFILYRPKEFQIKDEENIVRAKPELVSPGLFDYRPKAPPPFLFCPIRPKAFFTVETRGIGPQGKCWLPLCASRQKAKMLGKRFHPKPLIIKVLAQTAHSEGHIFHYAGWELYLTNQLIKPVWLELPQAPVKRLEKDKEHTTQKKNRDKEKFPDSTETHDKNPILPGSFMPSLEAFGEIFREKGKRAKRREKKRRLRGRKKQ